MNYLAEMEGKKERKVLAYAILGRIAYALEIDIKRFLIPAYFYLLSENVKLFFAKIVKKNTHY